MQAEGDQLGAQPLQLALQLVGVGGQVCLRGPLLELRQLVAAGLRRRGQGALVGGQQVRDLLKVVVQAAGGHHR